MTEVISPDNKELLTYVLGDIHNKLYIDVVRDLKQQTVQRLESGELEPADFPITHHFAPNVYMRQMDAKAGTFCVSKMHRTEHFIMFLTGSCSVMTENGIEHIKAPCVLRTMPGTQRVGYFHEDTSCITIHPTQSTDLKEIEQQVIVPEEEKEQFLAALPSKFEEIE
ncbi:MULTISPECIES: hypothetical protein [Acinetobacter calcoaceticus/baumannii complex]|uniref:hypothetical protein n=1 Tax=Acinetobacter calcoaceticus/baumannii complex TaxID=909768 RepID=UPI000452424F|nr:hypothetical protein [Acinetobacter sp. 1245593]EXH09903.1 hypothetical protein J627_3557 [Acinetobacter sp. 1245593]HEM7285175.1 hypothetical protein [Acinetobacter nosocomialis]HEM8327593.1 hypothetical protein [Acinetobacter nosocomialis]